ncbi:hypothetical protein [Marimonas arenosa]|uniref:Uncharacterized protein n=1 Tax=Marimonas arenosa TaxID=1795305 RepID=A0AAE3WBN4_9RHOB|nr:hypothetical protein [Marimonas arenosa]MDQ2089742.1 hypothetical protein [Marimonas arenosa]
MTAPKLIMHAYAWASLAVVVIGLVWLLIFPPPSMRVDRDGVPHFTPLVEHPISGEGVSVNVLIRHYRGD